jgi:hypothetical protein
LRSLRPVLIMASVAFALALATSAAANQTFHTLTAPLSPINGQPLQSGWVHDIHMNGNVTGGREVYHVAGAIPNTAFQVEILFYLGAGCLSANQLPTINTALLTTNGAGNANGAINFPANPTSTVTTFSAIWQLVGPNGPAYTTPCETVLIGGK